MRALYAEHAICRYANGVNPRAIVAPAAGVLVALVGLMIPSPRFLFDGAWISVTLVSFVIYYLLMRPAPEAAATLTSAVPEIR
ncbi:MAG TPA: hypothetical protein VFR37_19410 [Longimicrobium sp.]|nr:hypothetical protein [Longimicrobium sp.]